MMALESEDVIRTARLVLRPVREGDDARIFALFSNWNVLRFLRSPPSPYTADEARGFVRARANEGANTITQAITLRLDH